MSSLPEEIYLDILLRVPEVKSLLVCKCVCKSWFQLISDPDFVKTHLNISIRQNKCSLLLQNYDDFSFHSINSDSLSSRNALVPIAMNLPGGNELDALGSCNGIVYGWNRESELFFLWNPATMEFKMLPRLEQYNGHYHIMLHGFGYDEKTDDYKVVSSFDYGEGSVVRIYSLRSNSWKCFMSTQCGFHLDYETGVFHNGVLHWLGPIAMDIGEETFKELQLPMPRDSSMSLGVLEDRLCLLVENKEECDYGVHVWVMQDYGVQESWTKLYAIPYQSIRCWSCVDLMGFLMNREFVLRDTSEDEIILYDPKRKTARKPDIGRLEVGGAVSYFESLVSLKSTAAAEEGKLERNITGNSKKRKTRQRNITDYFFTC